MKKRNPGEPCRNTGGKPWRTEGGHKGRNTGDKQGDPGETNGTAVDTSEYEIWSIVSDTCRLVTIPCPHLCSVSGGVVFVRFLFGCPPSAYER